MSTATTTTVTTRWIVQNDQTGGRKEQTRFRMDLLPWDVIWEDAKLYAVGAQKYEERNWERGYQWSLSFAALIRHALKFWLGESIDPESGCHHLAAVRFHAAALMRFERKYPGLDDRPYGVLPVWEWDQESLGNTAVAATKKSNKPEKPKKKRPKR